MLNQRAINQYKYANAAGVVGASPYQIISMLMQGALDRMAQAKGCIQTDQVEARNECIKKATDIIECLRGSLDHKHDQGMTENLESLYDYMSMRLFQANLKNSADIIDEVSGLLETIYDGWKQLGEDGAAIADSGSSNDVSLSREAAGYGAVGLAK